MTTATHACPRCDEPLPTDAPEGLCPRCLLLAGVDETVATQVEGTSAAQPGDRMRYLGDYELIDEIARGGMGVVFKARQVTLNRTVALKMILAGQLASEAEVQRFLVEAEAAANLQHPNIVAIHEVGRHGDQHYFSMDFVDGRDLASIVAEKPLGIAKAAEYTETIARAIQYAHEKGTLHRDLKPQNILIDADGRPRITDFGLAKRIDDDSGLTASGSIMGSPSYMPPEQAMGRQDLIGPRSDVYSLGAVLYQLLTGHPPIAGKTLPETLAMVATEPPVPPSRLNNKVPKDLETICLKCLEKGVEQRYESALALAEDLERFREHQPILARPASRLRRVWGWAQRHPWAICTLLSLAVVATMGLAYGLYEQTQYLQHIASHPDYVRAAGPLMEAVGSYHLESLSFMILLFALVDFQLRSRGVRWRDIQIDSELVDLTKPLQPVSPRALFVYGVLGIAGVLHSMSFIARLIEVWVWEGQAPLGLIVVSVFPTLWFGLALMLVAVREQRSQSFGIERHAPDDAAVRYSLHTKADARLLDLPRVLKSWAVQLGAIFAICILLPAEYRLTLSLNFVVGWGLGAGMACVGRFRGYIKQCLATMPLFIPLFVAMNILGTSPGDPSSFIWYVAIFFGVLTVSNAHQQKLEELLEQDKQAQEQSA